MGLEERKQLIQKLEKSLNARVLVLVLGDRQNLETKLAPDMLPLISEHLSRSGETDRLALFLYTTGGDSIASWGLVNLVRQYCKRFIVLVPFRALSAGTLIALGADELVIGKHGLLSPVDPSVASPFSPSINQGNEIRFLPVSVEDMIGFINLAKEELGIKSEAYAVEILKTLAQQVHPLALGAVYRARMQSGSLAKQLLQKHVNDAAKIEKIIDKLTKDLPTHSYLIGRQEAEDIGLEVATIDAEIDQTMWNLYTEYQNWFQFTKPLSLELEIGEGNQKKTKYDRAAVESLHDGSLFQHVFLSEVELFKMKMQQQGMQEPIVQVVQRILYQGWISAVDGRHSS